MTTKPSRADYALEDLSERKFGLLTAKERAGYDGRAALWFCVCDCGRTFTAKAGELIGRKYSHCGCIKGKRSRLIDRTGQTYGRLLVIRRAKDSLTPKGAKQPRWWCRCECGNEISVLAISLANGDSTSCGCYALERRTVHGHTKLGARKSPTYKCWNGMMARGHWNSTDELVINHYAKRGIRVCSHWANGADGKVGFECFLEDMGERPSDDHSIDRIRNDDGYWCGHCDECVANGWTANCRWATRSEQQRNKTAKCMVRVNGKLMRAREAAAVLGLTPSWVRVLYRRHGESLGLEDQD